MYQGGGQPLKNSGGGDQYYNNKNRNRSYDKERSFDRNITYSKTNQNFRGRNIFGHDRNRGKYKRGDRRNFKDRDMSYSREVGIENIKKNI